MRRLNSNKSTLCSHSPLYFLKYCFVNLFLGISMQPTLNPKPYLFLDWVLVRILKSPSETEFLVGKVVYSEREDRKIIKRLTRLEHSKYCWLESDAGSKGFYDSNVFGPVPPEAIKGTFLLNLKNIFISYIITKAQE